MIENGPEKSRGKQVFEQPAGKVSSDQKSISKLKNKFFTVEIKYE